MIMHRDRKKVSEENRNRTEYGILWNRCTYQKKNACISEIQKLMRQPEGMQAFKTIGVLWGFRDRKTLETAGADDLIDRPDELLQFV